MLHFPISNKNKKMVEVIITEKYGLANTIDEKIYLHPILDEFPSIKTKIIRHEMEHIHSKGKFWKNRKVDALTSITFSDLLPIYKRKPSLFLQQYSPIIYKDNTIFFEWSLIILYFIYAGVGTLIYYLINLFSKNDSTFFWSVIGNMVIILIIVFFIYFGWKRLIKYINEEANNP